MRDSTRERLDAIEQRLNAVERHTVLADPWSGMPDDLEAIARRARELPGAVGPACTPPDPADTANVGDVLPLTWCDFQANVMCDVDYGGYHCTRRPHPAAGQHMATVMRKVVCVWPHDLGLVDRLPPGWVRACPWCDLDVEALPPRRICDECETEIAPKVGEILTGEEIRQLLPDGAVVRHVLVDGRAVEAMATTRAVGVESDNWPGDRNVIGHATYRVESLPDDVVDAVIHTADCAGDGCSCPGADVERDRGAATERVLASHSWSEIEELARELNAGDIAQDPDDHPKWNELADEGRRTYMRLAQHVVRAGWAKHEPAAGGQHDQAAAIDGAAVTLRAHASVWFFGGARCTCGWSAPIMAEQRPGHDHAGHVAEQLAAAGALGTVDLRPALVDAEGDLWWPLNDGRYVHGNVGDVQDRAHIEEQYGPVHEKAAES